MASGPGRRIPGREPEACGLAPSDLFYYGRRGVTLCEGDAHDAAAAAFDGFAADDALERPVRALGQHVGLQAFYRGLRVVFVEDDDRVHTAKGGDHFCTFGRRCDRSTRSLDFLNGSIGVDADNQRLTFARRILQIADVPWMQDVVVR